KDILPEEIKLYFDNYNDIYYYYLIKIRNPLIDRDNFNSNLINIEQAFYLQKDIFNIDNNLSTFLNDNNRTIIEFKLLLRGSTNGFASKNFHKLCDKKKQIIVVIKIKENKQIIGGYNSVGWNNNNRSNGNGNNDDNNSHIKTFLFSFGKKEKP